MSLDTNVTRANQATRAHWPTLVFILLTLAAALLLHGYVGGEVVGAGTVRPPGADARVPERIRDGGPVVGIHAGAIDAASLPRRTAILSFDDGPDPTWTPQILRILQRHGVPGTFFLLGNQMLRYPDLVRQELRQHNEIGSHSFSHPDPTLLSPRERRSQLEQAQLALVGVTGLTTNLYRPPYSFSNDALDDGYWDVIREAHAQGYVTVLADIDSRDWERPGVNAIVDDATPHGGQGALILMHDAGGNRAQTVAALDILIPRLKAMGYRFTTVGQAFHVEPYGQASPGQLLRGRAVSWATKASGVMTTVFWAAFLVAGMLTVGRLLLMVAFARRHGRKRRAWLWGAPVTEPVSVIVPAYNEREGIEAAVRSIAGSDHPVEVIVVDDGSTDGTADLVESLGLPNVTVVRKRNGGKPSSLNAGMRVARHDLLVLVDGDTRFEPDTVRRLVQPFAAPLVGAVSGNAKVGNRRRLLGRWQHIEYVMGFNLDRRLYDVLQCMPTVPGAVGGYRRRALAEAGWLSDDTLAEDTDLTTGIVRAGWQVVYEDTARAWTEVPSSWGQLWKQRYRWCYGTLQAMWKHRRAVIQRGPSGRYGRRGLLLMALFQVALPLTAPVMDLFLLYGILFRDLSTTLLLWGGMVAVQLLSALYAFHLDGERIRVLWSLPLQQLVYRQLMYLVVFNSVLAALYGIRLPWVKLRRTGEVDVHEGVVGAEPAARR